MVYVGWLKPHSTSSSDGASMRWQTCAGPNHVLPIAPMAAARDGICGLAQTTSYLHLRWRPHAMADAGTRPCRQWRKTDCTVCRNIDYCSKVKLTSTGFLEETWTTTWGTRTCRQRRKTDCTVQYGWHPRATHLVLSSAAIYRSHLLVPAHADSGVKPTARYAESWPTTRCCWYPPMQTVA